MPTLRIEVALDSDAMTINGREEVARMLAKVPNIFESPDWNAMNLRDSNGNTVGQAWIEGDE